MERATLVEPRSKAPDDICYWCGAAQTSREHVPPRSIFPEKKDLAEGAAHDFRRNLLTVPSCPAHNEATSTDDQIASLSLLLLFQNNAHALRQFETKAIRAFTRDRALPARVMQLVTPITLPDGRETAAVRVDARAIARMIEKIARALYFHHVGVPWDGVVQTASNELLMPDLAPAPGWSESERMLSMVRKIHRYGAHQEIFFYQMLPNRNGTMLFRFCFYEGTNFFAGLM